MRLKRRTSNRLRDIREAGIIAGLGIAGALGDLGVVFLMMASEPSDGARPAASAQTEKAPEPARNCRYVGRYALRVCE